MFASQGQINAIRPLLVVAMAPEKPTAKPKPRVASVESRAGKAKAVNVKAKDKEPKPILDVTNAGTGMVQRKDVSAFVTGLKYKATNGKSEAQQLLQDINSSCIMQETLIQKNETVPDLTKYAYVQPSA